MSKPTHFKALRMRACGKKPGMRPKVCASQLELACDLVQAWGGPQDDCECQRGSFHTSGNYHVSASTPDHLNCGCGHF